MSLSKKDEETSGIRVALVIEMIGRPPEYITQRLNSMIEQMDKEKGVRVISKDVKKPVLIEGKKDFYTSFAEIEVELEQILHLAILMFKYMPAHIEIISPELIVLTKNGWDDILNELTRRLHGYDEVAKILQFQNYQLREKLKQAGIVDSKSPGEAVISDSKVKNEKVISKKKEETKNKTKKK